MGRLTSLAARKVRITLLYDFYGQLLTARQRDVLALYYQADLSLGEIAEQQEVSRQAVYDIIKRSERTLEDLESKLQLVEKHETDRLLLVKIGQELRQASADLVRIGSMSDEGESIATVATRLDIAAERLKTLN